MKQLVGIVTLQGKFNYGNRLQNYAVDQIYRSIGYLPVSLIYDNPKILQKSVFRLTRLFDGGNRSSVESLISIERLEAFNRFNSHLKMANLVSLDSDTIDRYRYFSVGSDQIWRMGRTSLGDEWKFLQFASPEQRIALAPSFGTDGPLSKTQLKRLSRYLCGYSHLSVREESGARFIQEATGRSAEVICDPSLVLTASEWRSVSDNRLTPNEEYVFAYLLGIESDEVRKTLDIASRHGELPVVTLSDRERDGELPAGPAEFISLVDNASWVVTDSFHGSVFASIFQKPLTIVHRDGGYTMYANMFGRLETLSKKLGITHKVYGSPEFDSSRSNDYRGVAEAIDCERMKFMRYLEACLDV